MAQAGFTPIQLYYSTTASAVPTAGNLASGELAININDGKLYYKNASNVVTLLATAGSVSSQWVTSGSNIYYNTGNVGIGTSSPLQQLHLSSASATGMQITYQGVGAARIGVAAGNLLTFGLDTSNGTTTRATLDSSGNLGLGVTPSAWEAGRRALQVAGSTANYFMGANANSTVFGTNFFNDGTNKYLATGFSNFYLQGAGEHRWYNAPSGTAGNAISFTQAMTLDASGNLGIGTTSPLTKLEVNGGAANTYLRIVDTRATYPTYIGAEQGATVFGRWGLGESARISSAGGFSVGTTSDPGAGAIYATGNITAYFSDNRLKTRLGGIEGALDKVEKLSGFYYEANETAQALGYKPKREVGVSAQEVQAVLPEVVSPAPVDQQYLTVDYERLVPLLIEAIKELRAEVRALKGV